MRRTKQEAELTRQQLIDSALEVFLSKGYAATTIEDIARHAGLTRGAYYWHFKSKSELHDAICEQETAVVNDMLDKLLEEGLPPIKKLQKYLDAVLTNFYSNRRFNQYIELTRLKSESGLFHEFSEMKTGTLDRSFRNLEIVLKACQSEGTITRDLNARDLTIHINMLITGIYRLHFTAPSRFPEKKQGLKMIRNYLKLIRAAEST